MHKIIPFVFLAASLYFLSQGMGVAFAISFVATGVSAAAIPSNGWTIESPEETAQREADLQVSDAPEMKCNGCALRVGLLFCANRSLCPDQSNGPKNYRFCGPVTKIDCGQKPSTLSPENEINCSQLKVKTRQITE